MSLPTLRDRLIARGLVVPAAEPLLTFQDRMGRDCIGRPCLSFEATTRLRARLEKSGLLMPGSREPVRYVPPRPVLPVPRSASALAEMAIQGGS